MHKVSHSCGKQAQKFEWDLNLGDRLALGWRGGCIIRAKFLHRIAEAFERTPAPTKSVLLDSLILSDVIENAQPHWRDVVSTATQLGVPIPAFSSALAYFDSYRNSRLSANLIQAMRDYFGAHTYHKIRRSDGQCNCRNKMVNQQSSIQNGC